MNAVMGVHQLMKEHDSISSEVRLPQCSGLCLTQLSLVQPEHLRQTVSNLCVSAASAGL